MTDKTVFEPEDFYIDLDYAPVHWDFEHLIGRRQQIQVLQGTVPVYSDDGRYLSLRLFPDVAPVALNPNRAFLFSGKAGNGKHTLNTAFALNMFDKANPDFRYYMISLDQLKQKDNNKTVDNINCFFDKLEKMAGKSEYEDFLLYLNLGDISRVIKNRTAADTIACRITKLLRIDSAMIIVTASSDKFVEEIPLSVKKVFLPIFLPDPTFSDRTDYFELFNKMNKRVQWGISSEEMAGLTGEFTFLMLEHLVEQLYLWAQGEINNKFDEKVIEEYLCGYSEDVFFIPHEIIKSTAEQIRSQLQIKVKKHNYQVVTEKVAEASSAKEDMHEEKHESETSKKEAGKIEPRKIDSISEIRKIERTLSPAIRLNARNQSGNSGPNIIKISNE